MKDFNEAVEKIKTVSVLDNYYRVRLYGLYKQSTVGDTDDDDDDLGMSCSQIVHQLCEKVA